MQAKPLGEIFSSLTVVWKRIPATVISMMSLEHAKTSNELKY